RIYRLFVPFLLFGAITVLGKYLVKSFVDVNDPPSDIASGLLAMFLNTPANPVVSIWYIWVLLIYSLLTPWLWRVLDRKAVFLLPVLLVVVGAVAIPAG